MARPPSQPNPFDDQGVALAAFALGTAAMAVGVLVPFIITGPLNAPKFSLAPARAVTPSLWHLAWWVPLCWMLSVIVHELGHVACGLAARFRFEALVVWPLAINRRLRITFARGMSAAHGLAICSPTGSDRLLQRYKTFVVGGPASNIILAVVACAAAIVIAPKDHRLASFAFVLSGVSLFVAAANLVPARVGEYMTDGAVLAVLRQPGNKAESLLATILLAHQWLKGTDPRTWDPALIAKAVADRSLTQEAGWACLLAHMHADAKGDADEARHWIGLAYDRIEHVEPALRNVILAEVVYVRARYSCDAVGAENVRQTIPKDSLPEATELALTAVIAIAASRFDEGAKAIAQLQELGRSPKWRNGEDSLRRVIVGLEQFLAERTTARPG